MKRKVAIYARVSTEHEAQLSALDNQVQYYDDILKKNPDWILYDRYIDEGITGTSTKKRKNFMRMMEDAKAGRFDLIVTREVSRFARNTVDTLQETRKLKNIGVEVYFIEDNIWTFNDEDGELKLTIMATLAQNESKKTSQRVKAGQMISFQNGVFYGSGNILGYNKVGQNLEVNEEQAEIVRYIYSEYLNGKGTVKIADELTKKGVPTSTGLTTWSAPYISRVLRNPFYSGTIVYRKSYIPDYLEQKAKINYGEVEKVVVEGRHEPIISKEDFKKVQQIMDSHSRPIKLGRKQALGVPKNIWSKKLVCECGSNFNRKIYHKNKNETTYCYICYNKKTRPKNRFKDSCDMGQVPEWKLQYMAEAIFRNLTQNSDNKRELAERLFKGVDIDEHPEKKMLQRIDKLNQLIENETTKLDRLMENYLDETIDINLYDMFQKKLSSRIEKYKIEKIELEKQYDKIFNTIDDIIKDIKPIHQVVISDWLTATFLSYVENSKSIPIFNNKEEIINYFKRFSFVSHIIVNQFFNYKNYELPVTYEAIAEIHGITKGAVSKKIDVFLNDIRIKTLKDIFEEMKY